MASEAQRANPRRSCLLAGALSLVLVVLVVSIVAAAPGVPETCTRVLELARLAGEPAGEAERELCEAHYGRQRASRGPLGWARLSWCIRRARSIPEAGAC